MENQEYQDNSQYYSEVPAERGSNSLARVPEVGQISIGNVSNRVIQKMERTMGMAAAQERCKTQLMGEVIVNTTALSALGDQVSSVVPSAEKPVRHIINTYAASSAIRIAERW